MMSGGRNQSVACENEFAIIKCSHSHEALKIFFARYGVFRPDPARCYDEPILIRTNNCSYTNVTNFLRSLCDNKFSCSIRTHHNTLNILNPCEGYINALQAQYECIPEKTITSSTILAETPSVIDGNRATTSDTTLAETASFSVGNRATTSEVEISNTAAVPLSTTIGVIVGAILFVLLAAVLFVLWRRRRSRKQSIREVESAERSANARSVSLFMNQAIQSDADYITPATLPGDGDYENLEDVRPVAGQSYVNSLALPGDGDYAQPDATGLPLQEVAGYQTLNIQSSNLVQPTSDAAYVDYDVASSRQAVGASYENCLKRPGDGDYAEPDATGPPLQEAPGYDPLQIQPSTDVAYAEYDVK